MFTPVRAKRPMVNFTPVSAKRFRPMSQAGAFRRTNRRTTPGPKTTGSLMQQVRSLQRTVRQLAPEIKHFDQDIGVSDVTTSGAVVNCCQIAQGDSNVARTGNTIFVKSVTISGSVVRGADVILQPNACYQVALVIDKDNVADSSPTAANIFNPSDPRVLLLNSATLERFRVLYLSPVLENLRIVTDLDGLATSAVPTQSFMFKTTVFPNVKVSYNGGASSDIQKNGIYVVFLSNDSSNTIDFAGVSRVSYTDV